MTATHWVALSVVAGLGALGGAMGLRATSVTGHPAAGLSVAGNPLWIDSLHTRSYAATLEGVKAAERVVLNNIAHAQTPGYRAVQPLFESWFDPTGQTTGVMRPRMDVNLHSGWPIDTGRELDVRIDGTGYFQVMAPDAPGGWAYTRVGHLSVDAQGFLAVGLPGDTARRIAPRLAVPDAATDLRVSADGTVEALAPETLTWIALGTLRLATFPQASALRSEEDVMHATAASGAPRIADPGASGLGKLRSGTLEGSNVDLAVEFEHLRHLRGWAQRLNESLQ